MGKDYYLLFIWRGVEPKLLGPFETIKLRDKKAKELRDDHGTLSVYYPVEISQGAKVEIGVFSGDFFEEQGNITELNDEEQDNQKKCLNHCPKCNATDPDIEWGDKEWGDTQAWQNATCKKCGCEFSETYNYSYSQIDPKI